MMKLLLALALFTNSSFAEDPPIDRLKVADGFKIGVYASGIEDARSLTLGKDGIVYVGNRGGDKVYAVLPDKNGDGKADAVKQIAEGLNSPNGVAYKNGDLYIAEISRIRVIRGVEKKLDNKNNKTEIWGPEFPTETHHGWKFIAFGPDGWLYVPVGAPCNVCDKDPNLFAAIHRVSPDGKKRELVAKGVRNTVGFDWNPDTKELWFTENGRDWMGDEIPPCELNVVKKMGAHYGFPHCHGDVPDPEFGKGKKCADYVAPEHKFPAHSAPLGMRFLRKNTSLKGKILAAEHGSWNRSTPIGYQVTLIDPKNGKAEAKPFISGFLRGSSAWGRPVDIQELEDGSILVSDDKAGAIYRVTAK
jgi:glucose/arabinose dehydrogenase